MIQRMLTKYGLAFHVAGVCIFPFWYLGQPRVFGLVPLLWLSVIAAEWMFLLPSVHRSETLADARWRVLRALVWDPFLYIGAALVVMVAAQWLNSGCELIYLPDADIWQLSQPPVAWAPFSVESRAAFTQVAVFTACVTVGVILRTALSKTSKRLLLMALACMSGCVALFWVVQVCLKAQPYFALTSGLEPASLGAFFGFWLLVGMGLFADTVGSRQRGGGLLYLFGFVGNLLGTIFFASPLALAVYVLLVVLIFFYWLIYLSFYVSKPVQLKLFLGSCLLAGAVVSAGYFLTSWAPIREKSKAAVTVTESWQALSARNKIRSDTALAVWQEHPWVGVGADGFHHFVGLSVKGQDWKIIKRDQSFVYNDSLQFLCEYGVFGAGLILAVLITLLAPVCYRTRLAWKSKAGEEHGQPFILRLSPFVITGSLAAVTCFLESLVASPFRSPGLLLSWMCVMASMPAFLPIPARGATPR